MSLRASFFPSLSSLSLSPPAFFRPFLTANPNQPLLCAKRDKRAAASRPPFPESPSGEAAPPYLCLSPRRFCVSLPTPATHRACLLPTPPACMCVPSSHKAHIKTHLLTPPHKPTSWPSAFLLPFHSHPTLTPFFRMFRVPRRPFPLSSLPVSPTHLPPPRPNHCHSCLSAAVHGACACSFLQAVRPCALLPHNATPQCPSLCLLDIAQLFPFMPRNSAGRKCAAV